MKLFPLNKNALALTLVCSITIAFFIAGLFKVLDYFIVKALLFTGFGVLVCAAIFYASKSDDKKNRLKDELQDDSH